MNHLDEDSLMEYILETSADPAEWEKIAEHLAACPDCRKRFEDLRKDIEIVGSIRPLRPAVIIPGRPVHFNPLYRAIRIAALIIFGIAVGLGGSRWFNRQPATVLPAYIALPPLPDSIIGCVVADATSMPK
jgi:hypothetical protein